MINEVIYDNPLAEFICGPQLIYGSEYSLWPWHDDNALDAGYVLGDAFPEVPPADENQMSGYQNYYDQGLTQYLNYARTGDTAFLEYFRKIEDCWWQSAGILEGTNRNFTGEIAGPTSYAPRMSGLDGLMLRALDGRNEFWDWLYEYVRGQLFVYLLPAHLDGDEIYNGVRDSGMLLRFCANIANVLPDTYPLQSGGEATDGAAKRELLITDLNRWVNNYWIRLQHEDGSWRWGTESQGYYYTGIMQPFHVGLLLEGLIQYHKLTDEAATRASILKAIDCLYTECYDTRSVVEHQQLASGDPNIKCRWHTYFRFGGYTCPSTGEEAPTIYDTWPGSAPDLSSGFPNGVIEARQLNSTIMHAYGYAYHLTGDEKYRQWGDEVFAASFGEYRGPLVDGLTNLAYLVNNGLDGKSYNQNYRAAGQYLAYRTANEKPDIDPDPDPDTETVQVEWPSDVEAQNDLVDEQWEAGYRLKRTKSVAEFERVPE